MKVVAVVQARLASSRLPGKVLYPAPDGRPLLAVLLERVARAERVDEIRLAIPDTPLDRSLLGRWASWHGVLPVEGSETDVLGRFVAATSDLAEHELVVRVTGDCPLVNPRTIDLAVWEAQVHPEWAYVQTGEAYPEGLDVEVFSRAMLRLTGLQAMLPSDREHVTPWMRRMLPPERQHRLELPEPLGHLRLTVDDYQDYQVVCAVLRALGPERCELEDIVALARTQPQVFVPNAGTERNAWKRQAQREVDAHEEAQHGECVE